MKRILVGIVIGISSLFALDVSIPMCPQVSQTGRFEFTKEISEGVPVTIKFNGIKCFNVVPELNILNQVLTSESGESFQLPFGLLSFDANITGSELNVTFEIPFYVNHLKGYMKKMNDGKWRKVDDNFVDIIANNQFVDEAIITFRIFDGGEYDLDGEQNGRIKDPGGPYIRVQNPQPQEVSVPFSPWVKVLMILAIGLLALIRRR